MKIRGRKLLFLIGTAMALVVLTSPVYGVSDRLPQKGTGHPPSEQNDSRQPVAVLKVLSGDTLLVMYRGRRTVVRLRGVNVPEAGDPRAQEAVSLLEHLVNGKSIELGFGSPPEMEKDDRGRLLAYLYADGEDVNEQMGSGGWSAAAEAGPTPGQESPRKMQPPPPAPVQETVSTSSVSGPKARQTSPVRVTSVKVYISARDKTYHRQRCRLLEGVPTVPVLKNEAIRLGYKRCRRCKP